MKDLAFYGIAMGIAGISILLAVIGFSIFIGHINLIFFNTLRNRDAKDIVETKHPGRYFYISIYDWNKLSFSETRNIIKSMKNGILTNSFILKSYHKYSSDDIYFIMNNKTNKTIWEEKINSAIKNKKQALKNLEYDKLYNSI